MAIFDSPSSAICCLPLGTPAPATGDAGARFQKVQKLHFHSLGGKPRFMIRKTSTVFFALASLSWTSSSILYGAAPSRVFQIGILIPESAPGETQTVKGLRDGLREQGYIEGENLTVELRDAKGDRSALQPAAAELVNKKVNVIFTTGTRATEVAKAATKEIPIVFRHPADPVAVGLLKNMKRPEGNVTGVAAFSSDTGQKRLEVLKALVPKLRRLHIFYDANNKFSADNLVAIRKGAAKLQLEVVEHPVKTSDELQNSLDYLQARDGDAIFLIPDALIESNASIIFDGAKKLKLTTMCDQENWVTKGCLAAYGPNYTQMGRQAALLVDKLFKGAKPKDVPVQWAAKFDLVINLRTANIIGFSIAPETLAKADRVIR
jgi:putative tryptophan/tyrosine transport system substrate-binding protein